VTNPRVRESVAKLIGLEQYPPRPLVIPARYARESPPDRPPVMSILTPSFNQGRFIGRTLESVLGQDYPRLEYIVQDGGSTDETLSVVDGLKDELHHFESEPDSGQADAINKGFRHASGEIMAYINSDDVVLPGALSYVARYFERHPGVDVVYSHRIVIDQHDREIGRWILPKHDWRIMAWADFVPQETLFWRRKIWERTGARIDESFRYAMDWDLLLRFRDAGANVVRVPRFLSAFRVHDAQKTSALLELGTEEMDRIRQRVNGRPVTSEDFRAVIRWYLVRRLIYRSLFRLHVLPC
jgi:glycosyltransferase involved in cell wall biosynthesis